MPNDQKVPSEYLKESVARRSRDDVIGALVVLFAEDPGGCGYELTQGIQYALDNGFPDLLEPHDGAYKIDYNSSNWDENYFAFARSYLRDNFSKERIKHVQEVGKKLYPPRAAKQVAPVEAPKYGHAVETSRINAEIKWQNEAEELKEEVKRLQRELNMAKKEMEILKGKKTMAVRGVIIIAMAVLLLTAFILMKAPA